ncbi:MAG: molybdate ABC transporter substrate-binding protein [Syntrophomonas sp.]
MKFGRKSKINIAIILSCLLIALLATSALAAGTTGKSSVPVMKAGDNCAVTASVLNFRTGPSTNYKIMSGLKRNTQLTVVEKSNDWYKVKTSAGKVGFVCGLYLKALGSTASSAPAAANITPAPAQTAPANTASKPCELTVSAAASLTDAMNDIKKVYAGEQPSVTLTMNYASSGSLQQQIEQGAPADVFLSAATKQMKALADKKLIIDNTNKNLLRNGIVLVVPKDSDKIKSFNDLKNAKIIALGQPESVPAGQYGKEVLTNMKLWDDLQSKMVYAKDVRQVLAYVESGDADAGIVYSTDAKISDKVKVVAVAEESTHTPVVYPAAVVKSSKNPDAARAFLAFLSSDKAKAVFEKYGFSVINK